MAAPSDVPPALEPEKGTGTFWAKPPEGRSGKRCLSPFSGGFSGQRERRHGHVVDFHRLDHPTSHARRHHIQVLVDLLIEFYQAPLAVLAHVVAHGDDRLVRPAHGVDVLHPVDLIEDLLQRGRHQLFHFGRGMAGKVDVHVGQRDDNLRVFLARSQAQRGQPHDGGQENQDDREV
jgi:hypothetical protein